MPSHLPRINFRAPLELMRRIKSAAKARAISANALMREIIEKWLDDHDGHEGMS